MSKNSNFPPDQHYPTILENDFEDSTSPASDYQKVLSGSSHIWPEMFFYLNNKQLPNNIFFLDVDGAKAFEAVCQQFNVPVSQAIRSRSVQFIKQKRTDRQLILQIRQGIVICYDSDEDIIQLLYAQNANLEELRQIESILNSFARKPHFHNLHLLVYDSDMRSFRLRDFKLPESGVSIELNYNDDFQVIHDIVYERLSKEKSKGIVLLHGAPGTGKTSYIRHLITKLDKTLIYIPSSIAHRLGDPEFLPFLVNHTGSILIIEDAEDILQERKGGDNGTIANLLNLGDGLLSDCLNIQIICTFNAPLTRIDKALLRKGRVIASYEFMPLSVHKTNRLLQSLSIDLISDKEMTLAEVYYLKDRDFLKDEVKGIGF